MTKMHFDYAVALVRLTREHGRYPGVEIETATLGNVDVPMFLARQHAAAYITLFKRFSVRFNEQRFLKACGLEG